MQAAYDAWHAEREVDVSHVKALKAARRWEKKREASPSFTPPIFTRFLREASPIFNTAKRQLIF